MRSVESTVRALILDAHGVLLLPDARAYRAVMEPYDLSVSDVVCWNAHYRMMYFIDHMTEKNWPLVHREFAIAMGVPSELLPTLSPLINKLYLGSAWIAAPGARELLTQLEANDYRFAVASNTERGGVKELLGLAGVCSLERSLPCASPILDSHGLGHGKP
jgi:FMN phosphatase YigB (HAD superfamily)